MTMTPYLLLLLLLLSISSSLLPPTTSLCVPRNSSAAISTPASIPDPQPPPSPPSPTTTPTFTSTLSTIGDAVSSSFSGGGSLNSLCAHSDYPALCVSCATPLLPSITGTLDAAALLSINLRALQPLVKAVQTKAVKLQADTPDKTTADSYSLTAQYMGFALDDMEAAITAAAAKDKGGVATRASALVTYFGDAEDEFMEDDEPCPIAGDLEQLGRMAANILALNDLAFKKGA